MKPGYYVCENDEDCALVESKYEEVDEISTSATVYEDSDASVVGNYEDDGVSASGNYEDDGVSASGNYEDSEMSISGSGNYYEGGDAYGGGNYEDADGEGNHEKRESKPQQRPAAAAALQGRDWHGEFLALLDQKVSSPVEQLRKYAALHALSSAFAVEATLRAKTIVHELSLPVHSKTIRPIDAGGIAGGIKFMQSRIFFKFTLDHEGLYSGDEFAAKVKKIERTPFSNPSLFLKKAAGRELNGLESYLSFVLESGSKLRTALQVLIDFKGYRVIACSLLPIGANTLVYGSNDAGRTVHADDLRMTQLMKEAGMWLNLKPHLVAGTSLYGPADIEGHVGKDGNMYVLDTARVFPPEQPPRYFSCLIVPASGIVTSVDLPTNGFEASINEIIGSSSLITYRFSLGTIYSSSATGLELNQRCTALSEKQCFGIAVIVPNGFKGKFLYNLLRREFVQSYRIPLSSDAFSGFGRHNFREHNDEVAEASNELRTNILLGFCKDLRVENKTSVFIEDGEDLCNSLHSRGIPLRMLGLIWVQLDIKKDSRVSEIVLAEMVTRAAKQLIRMQMREAKENATSVVLKTLNHLLGGEDSAENDQFWELTMQIQLRSKYGSYSGVFSGQRDFGMVRKSTNMQLLYKRLLFVLGMSCNVTLNYSFVSRNCPPVPFPAGTQLYLDARIKTVVSKKVKQGFELALETIDADVLESMMSEFDQSGAMHHLFATQLAVEQCKVGRFEEAKALCLEVVTTPVLLPLQLRLIAALWFCKAEKDPSRRVPILASARNSFTGSSGLELFVLEELCTALCGLNSIVQARIIGHDFERMSSYAPLQALGHSERLKIFGRNPSVLSFFSSHSFSPTSSSTAAAQQLFHRTHRLTERPLTLINAALDMSKPFDLNYSMEEKPIMYSAKQTSLHSISALFDGLSNVSEIQEPDRKGLYVQVRNFVSEDGFCYIGATPKWNQTTLHRVISLILPKNASMMGISFPFLDITKTAVLNFPEKIGEYSQYHFLSKGSIIGLTNTGSLKQRQLDTELSESLLAYPNSCVFLQLQGGRGYCAALTDKGEIFSWGGNANDGNEQLGHGDGAVQHNPKPVNLQQKMSKISCAETFMGALSTQGDIFLWGRLLHTIWNFPVKAEKPFAAAAVDISCGAFGVSVIADDGSVWVHLLQERKKFELACIEELSEIPMCQIACGSQALLMLSQSDGHVYWIYVKSAYDCLVPDSLVEFADTRVDCVGNANGLRVSLIEEPCVAVMCGDEICGALGSTGNLFVWGGVLPIVSLALTGIEHMISLSGSIVARQSNDPVKHARPMLISSATTRPPEPRIFDLKHVLKHAHLNPEIAMFGEAISVSVSVPRRCHNKRFRIFIPELDVETSFLLSSKARPCTEESNSLNLLAKYRGPDRTVTVCLAFEPSRCKTVLASFLLKLVAVSDLNRYEPLLCEMLIKHPQLAYFSAMRPFYDSSSFYFAVRVKDHTDKICELFRLDDKFALSEQSLVGSKMGAFLAELLFVDEPDRRADNFSKKETVLKSLGEFSLGDSAEPIVIDRPAFDVFNALMLDKSREKLPYVASLRVVCADGYVYFPPNGFASSLKALITVDELIGDNAEVVEISVSKTPSRIGMLASTRITLAKGTAEANLTNIGSLGPLSSCFLVATSQTTWQPVAIIEVPILRSKEEVIAFCETNNRTIPEMFQQVAPSIFGCSLEDSDLKYVYPTQMIKINWNMDMTKGMANTHMIYGFLKGDRDASKIKTCAQCTANPAMAYIPNLPVDAEMEFLCGFMDETNYSYRFSEPVSVTIAADERDARTKNRKCLAEKNPPPRIDDTSASAKMSEEDEQASEKVLSFVSDPAIRKEVAAVVTSFGKSILFASYSVFRAAGLDAAKSGLVLAAKEKYKATLASKIDWNTILGDGILNDAQIASLDALLDATLSHLLESQILTDAQIPIHLHPKVLSLNAKYQITK